MKVAGTGKENQRRGDFLGISKLSLECLCTCSLTIVRDSSCPLLGNISWDTKYFDCNERINHLQEKGLFILLSFQQKLRLMK